jgi:hypothetical protein
LTFWRKWSGLPWGLGADPRDGRAACCFRTAQATREELGLPWPEAGALIRFDRGDDSFGVGVLPDERTLITVRHYGRLIVGPLAACSKMNLYRLR